MLNESPSPSQPISEGREERRRQLLAALRGPAASLLERLADELVDLPDDQVFGAIETSLRDLCHDFATQAHQAGIQAGKKRAIKAPVSSAPTARTMPASSATEKSPG